MSPPQKPTPPKACPVCLVAMQASATEAGIVHSCQHCGLSVTTGPRRKPSAR